MIALANGDRPNNGNFVNARNDFSAGESDKCYLTNFLFGQSLYAQGKKDEALVQFKLAKARFNLGSEASNNQVTSVNEFIAMVEAENAAANAKLNDPNIQKILASIAETNLSKGAVLKAQGVTDFNKVAERELFLYTENGDVYFFALVSEWDPELGVGDEYYHHDKGKSIEGDHIATYEKLRIDDYSVVIYTTIIAPFAEISNLHLKPSSTGIAHWVLYRKR
jgi:hypothetical protein